MSRKAMRLYETLKIMAHSIRRSPVIMNFTAADMAFVVSNQDLNAGHLIALTEIPGAVHDFFRPPMTEDQLAGDGFADDATDEYMNNTDAFTLLSPHPDELLNGVITSQ